jgi:hypothetical protein
MPRPRKPASAAAHESRKALHGQSRANKLGDAHNACCLADTAAFDRHRWADRRKRGRLHAERLLEIDSRPAEQARQVEVRLPEAVDAGIIGVVSGIVMNVDAGEGRSAADDLDHVAHKTGEGGIGTRRSGPGAIVVLLVRQRAHVGLGSLDVADEDQQRPRQCCGAIPPQHGLDGAPAGILIAVQENAHEKRLGVPAGKVKQ